MVLKILEVDLHHLSPHAVAFISELRCQRVVEGDGEMFVRLSTEDESGVDSFSELRDMARDANWASLYEVWKEACNHGCTYVHFSNQGDVFETIPTYSW